MTTSDLALSPYQAQIQGTRSHSVRVGFQEVPAPEYHSGDDLRLSLCLHPRRRHSIPCVLALRRCLFLKPWEYYSGDDFRPCFVSISGADLRDCISFVRVGFQVGSESTLVSSWACCRHLMSICVDWSRQACLVGDALVEQILGHQPLRLFDTADLRHVMATQTEFP